MALNIGTEKQKTLLVFPFDFYVGQKTHVWTLDILKLQGMIEVGEWGTRQYKVALGLQALSDHFWIISSLLIVLHWIHTGPTANCGCWLFCQRCTLPLLNTKKGRLLFTWSSKLFHFHYYPFHCSLSFHLHLGVGMILCRNETLESL